VIASARDLVAARRHLRALQARGQRHVVEAEGLRTVWRSWGEGTALVLLHGGHGAWTHWVRNIEALAAHHRVWVPDMPGFGDSDGLPGDPHAPDRDQRFLSLLRAGLQQLPAFSAGFDLVGFSFGGLVAARLASQTALAPAVRRLVLIGSAGHGGVRRQVHELLNWRALQGQARWTAHAHNLRSFMLHDPNRVDALALVVHAEASAATRFRSKQLSRTALLPACLDAFAGPVLLLWGEHDVTATPADIGPALVQGHPERQCVILPDGGHWLQYEQSAAVNRLLFEFLSNSR